MLDNSHPKIELTGHFVFSSHSLDTFRIYPKKCCNSHFLLWTHIPVTGKAGSFSKHVLDKAACWLRESVLRRVSIIFSATVPLADSPESPLTLSTKSYSNQKLTKSGTSCIPIARLPRLHQTYCRYQVGKDLISSSCTHPALLFLLQTILSVILRYFTSRG